MEKSAKKLCGFIFAALVAVGLVLAIVGMFTGLVTFGDKSLELFSELWGKPGAPSNTFAIIAFIVTIIGAAVLLIDAILRVFMGKDLKIVRIVGVALAFVGAILILVAGLLIVGDLNDTLDKLSGGLAEKVNATYSAAAGVWLGFIGGLVAAVGGGLPLLKAFN